MAIFSKHIASLSDEELVSRYKINQNPDILGVLFERYTDLVFMACMKYLKNEADSEDAAMQIFEKLIQDLSHYEIKNFSPWLRTVVRHHCLAILKQKQKRLQNLDSLRNATHGMEAVFFVKDEYEEKEWELTQLEQAMGGLNEAQKKCVELFYLQRKSYKDIEGITGYSLKQVKSHIQNGKRNLKNSLKQLSYEG